MKWVFNKFFIHAFISLIIVGMGIVLALVMHPKPQSTKQPAETNSKPQVRGNQTFMPDTIPLPKQSVAHLISKIETNQPVVFLTMDDGQDTNNNAVEFLKSRQWPVTLFLADIYAKENYVYFKNLVQSGATVQNHTLSHHYLKDLNYKQQKNEICVASDKVQEVFGMHPNLLRPPGGHYDSNTYGAAYECGVKTIVMWSAKVDGGIVQYQKGDRLVPGDIVLMHFRPKIMEDLAAFEAEIIKQNLYVARLEDWIRISN